MTKKLVHPDQRRSAPARFKPRAGQALNPTSARVVSDATFGREVLLSTKPVLVGFYAKRGGPCKEFAAALEQIAEDWHDRVKVTKLDVDRNLLARSDYEVYATPTLILFKNGKPAARRVGEVLPKKGIEQWLNAELMAALASETASVERHATEFRLSNGMHVVVIPDHRAPVVTHMVCYKVGAADDPTGASGLARLLQNLMFKSTEKFAGGEFSRIISRLGGQDSAATGRDWTYYLQRISSDQLRTVMELEADRMVHLHLTYDEVMSERQLAAEERRSGIESSPSILLTGEVDATLYLSHPYAIPVIGWPSELAKLTRDDAMLFYKHHYVPDNALLVVSGDVTADEVKRCAAETYGRNAGNPDGAVRVRRSLEPPHLTARRVTLKDPRAGTAMFRRHYVVPSHAMATAVEAAALDLLGRILGGGWTSRLSRKLVFDDRSASVVGSGYSGDALNAGSVWLYVLANTDDLSVVEAGVDAVLVEIRKHGVSELELARAKRSLLAKYIFESDSQEELTIRYGKALAIGRTINQLERWPAEVARVTTDDIRKVANTYLTARRSVTGWLLPEQDDEPDGNGPIP